MINNDERLATMIDCHVTLGIATRALRNIAQEDGGDRSVAREALAKIEEREKLSPAGKEIVAGLTKFADVVASGEPIEDHFTVRSVPIPKGRFDLMSRDQLIGLLEKIKGAVDGSEDAIDSCLSICELLGVNPSSNV